MCFRLIGCHVPIRSLITVPYDTDVRRAQQIIKDVADALWVPETVVAFDQGNTGPSVTRATRCHALIHECRNAA